MPTQRPPTPQEAEWYKSQGIDPATVTLEVPESGQQGSNGYSTTGAIAKSLQQKAGGTLLAGAGAIGLPALYGAVAGPPGILAGLGLGITGALAGGYVGQKGQEALEGEDTAKRLALEAQQAQSGHPIATTV